MVYSAAASMAFCKTSQSSSEVHDPVQHPSGGGETVVDVQVCSVVRSRLIPEAIPAIRAAIVFMCRFLFVF